MQPIGGTNKGKTVLYTGSVFECIRVEGCSSARSFFLHFFQASLLASKRFPLFVLPTCLVVKKAKAEPALFCARPDPLSSVASEYIPSPWRTSLSINNKGDLDEMRR